MAVRERDTLAGTWRLSGGSAPPPVPPTSPGARAIIVALLIGAMLPVLALLGFAALTGRLDRLAAAVRFLFA
jgi:hypothetical protein